MLSSRLLLLLLLIVVIISFINVSESFGDIPSIDEVDDQVRYMLQKTECKSYMNYPTIKIDPSLTGNNSNPSESIYIGYLNGTYMMVPQSLANSSFNTSTIVLTATYLDTIPTIGWGQLNITTHAIQQHGQNIVDDCLQSYLTGFTEGLLTATRIFQMWTNFAKNEFALGTPSPTLLSFMNVQLGWVRKQSLQLHNEPFTFNNNNNNNNNRQSTTSSEDGNGYTNSTIYWHCARLVMSQFDGLVNGYSASSSSVTSPMTLMELYLLTSAGDLETLNALFGEPAPSSKSYKIRQTMYENEQQQANGELEEDDMEEIKFNRDSIDYMDCSGLIRLLPNNQDVYFGHTTWRMYYGMLRIYKFISVDYQFFNLNYSVSFSSSPGFLSSKDDFYITHHGLAVMETTNNVFNNTLYSFVLPQTMLVWQRAIISNMVASSSPAWTLAFQQYNSGTYNNQWMVLDYKLFSPGEPLPENSFYILEQIPGYCEIQDMTDYLNKFEFWPSYNIPYFEYIYNVSGYPQMKTKYGNSYSYEQCPRALIFNRNATNIFDFQSMQDMMQFNQYKIDPLSNGNPLNSISSRADLLTVKPVAFGGVDSKITSLKQVPSLSCTAISGPTHQNGLPPFQWSATNFTSVTHVGLPDLWDFDWVEFGEQY